MRRRSKTPTLIVGSTRKWARSFAKRVVVAAVSPPPETLDREDTLDNP